VDITIKKQALNVSEMRAIQTRCKDKKQTGRSEKKRSTLNISQMSLDITHGGVNNFVLC